MKLDPYRLFPVFSNNRVKKSKPTVPSLVIIIFVTASFITLFLLSECFTNQQITILGVAGSTVFAVAVFFLSRSSEDSSAFLAARNHARVLSQILDYVEKELSNISFDNSTRINYPTNWLSLYTSIAAYLEYDYLSTLIDEFALIDKINESLASRDKDAVVNLVTLHRKKISETWNDFDIFAAKSNIFMFSNNLKESSHWSSQPRYRDFFDSFTNQFSDKIHALTIKYLEQHSGTCSEHDASEFIINELGNDAEYRHNFGCHVSYSREILFAIFSIHRDAFSTSLYYLGWGQLYLKDIK